jgi:hypothetical protein
MEELAGKAVHGKKRLGLGYERILSRWIHDERGVTRSYYSASTQKKYLKNTQINTRSFAATVHNIPI